jgi:pyocin large subunit-like protein
MSDKNYSNNIDEVRAKLVRAEACRKAIMREAIEIKPTFDKDDGLEREKLLIHPDQLQMHLFPVFNPEVEK